MPITHKLTLDVRKRAIIGQQRVVVRQGENGTQQIEAAITKDGEPYASSCTGVRLEVLHADGTWARVTAAKSGTGVTVTLPSAAINAPGTCRLAHFVFHTGETTVETTEGFELRILPAVDVSGEQSKPYSDEIEALKAKWAEFEAGARKAERGRVTADAERGQRVDASVQKADAATAKATEAAGKADAAATEATAAAKRADEAAKGASENVLVGTETATVVHVEDAWPTLLRECKVLGKSVQEGTPTPDFPQPITSVGKAEVVVTGKNLAQTMKGVSSKGITGTVNDDGSYHVAGTTTAAYANPFTPVDVYLPAGRHTLSGNLPSKNGKSALYAQVMVDGVYNTTSSGAKTFDVARPGTYGVSVTTPEAGATYDGDFTVQLELGTGATEFAKPSSSATPIDLQGHELRSLPTGVRDEVVVDRDGNVSLVKRVGSHIVLTVTNVASTESFQYAFIEVEDRPINGDYRFMCNRFGVGQRRPGCVYVAGGSRAAFFFCFELGTFTSKQEAEQWFADNPTQVVYQLAEPQTIPLGKVSVPALPESTSNVWNNDAISTEVSATYVRDVNIAFSELESRLTQAVLATAANI